MFGLSIGEVAVIALVALIVLGPERLPAAARLLGRTLAELRRATDELRSDLQLDNSEPPPPAPLTARPVLDGGDTKQPPAALPPRETE